MNIIKNYMIIVRNVKHSKSDNFYNFQKIKNMMVLKITTIKYLIRNQEISLKLLKRNKELKLLKQINWWIYQMELIVSNHMMILKGFRQLYQILKIQKCKIQRIKRN